MIHSPFNITCPDVIQGTGANPGAGNEWGQNGPTYRISELRILNFVYTADVNVADRIIYIKHGTLGNYDLLGSTAFPITASQTWQIIATTTPLLNTVAATDTLYIPLPDFPLFTSTKNIRIGVPNIQAGDTITSIRLIWQTWPLNYP